MSSLFQITRCAQNRLSRERHVGEGCRRRSYGSPAPNSEPTAIALRSPYCFANVPVRPNAHPGRTPSSKPDPLAPPYHEKTVTLPRHPFPPVPHPTPPTSCPSPRLRHFSPPIRPNPAISPTPLKHTYIRATLAQARDRPRRPETLPPERGKAPGNRRGVPCWRPVAAKALRPLSSSVTRCHVCVPNDARRHYRFAQDRRHPQLRHAQNVAESNRIRVSASAGTTVLGDARQSQTASSVSVHWTRSGGLHII